MSDVIDQFLKQFEELFHVLGLQLEEEELLDEEIEALIEKRIQARKDRNFQLSDQIRDQLKDIEYYFRRYTAGYTMEKRLKHA